MLICAIEILNIIIVSLLSMRTKSRSFSTVCDTDTMSGQWKISISVANESVFHLAYLLYINEIQSVPRDVRSLNVSSSLDAYLQKT